MIDSNITKITEQVSVSNIGAAREKSTRRFDRVVSCCPDDVQDNVACPNEKFPMADGPAGLREGADYSYETFSDAADYVVERLDKGDTVLVHCHAGISRSVSVASAALVVYHGYDWPEALHEVSGKRPSSPCQRLQDYAKKYARKNALQYRAEASDD